MNTLIRLGIASLALVELVLGIWAQFFPQSFYDVPTVDSTPPFSEHLMRDFGGASIGLAIVLAAAALWGTTRWWLVALVAYLAFALPHFFFHVTQLHDTTQGEAAVLVMTLAGSVVLPLVLVVLAVLERRRRTTMVE